MAFISFIARWLIWATLIILFVHNARNPKAHTPAGSSQTARRFSEPSKPVYAVSFLDESGLFLTNTAQRSAALVSPDFERFVNGFPLPAPSLALVSQLRTEAEADLSALRLYADDSLGILSESKYRMIHIITLQKSIFDELLSESNRFIKPGNAYHKQKLQALERQLRTFETSKTNLQKFYKQKLLELNFYTSTNLKRNSG